MCVKVAENRRGDGNRSEYERFESVCVMRE